MQGQHAGGKRGLQSTLMKVKLYQTQQRVSRGGVNFTHADYYCMSVQKIKKEYIPMLDERTVFHIVLYTYSYVHSTTYSLRHHIEFMRLNAIVII
jgi:hypothetical protein